MLNVKIKKKKEERKQEGGDIGGKDFKKKKREKKSILKGKVNDSGAYKHLKISTITDTSQKKGSSTLKFSPGFFSHTLYFNN